MSISHEDIRYKVISRLRDSILNTIDRIRASDPQAYLSLQQQLEEYRKILERKEDVPLIIRNERIIKDVGKPDIEVFGGRILIEVKVKASEFTDGFEKLSRYIRFYPYAEYAIITNYDLWEFYRVEKDELKSVRGVSLDGILENVLIKGIRIPLSTENVKNMFNPVVLLKNELHHVFRTHSTEIKALYEAYRNIIKILYEKASDEEIEELFIRHTLMQMIVSSCLTASLGKSTDAKKACSGVEIEAEVILPYLNWWEPLISRELLSQSDRRFLESLMESVYSRAMLLDWRSEAKEDIFRELYEILIDAETRRKIGEYYTPLWLVEYMVNKVSDDIGGFKGKIILDPFCGSGTFLVASFYKKVEEGEDPDSAIKEVVGFDINPLAVSIARAELMIAYQSLKKQVITPLVFNTDSATLLFYASNEWKPMSFINELQTIEKRIRYASSPLFKSNRVDFSEVLEIEVILRECFKEASRSAKVKEELKKRLFELREHAWKGLLTSQIVETLTDEDSIDAIARLIEKYGNGVWAVSITSLFAPYIIREVKVDVILTNPPWAQLTEPKGSYGELLRREAITLFKGL